MPKNFVFATAAGVLLGVLLVYWTRPATAPGVTFLVVLCVLLAHVAAAIANWVGGRFAKPKASATTAELRE